MRNLLLDIKEFLNCYAEWHALVQGFCEVICPWPPLHRTMSAERTRELDEENHYYKAGRFFGVVGWIGLAKLIHVLFW